MHIKELPASERPREKMLYYGAGSLSNSELLALVLRTGTGEKSAVQLAEELIAYADANIGTLGAAEVRELTQIGGVGEAKACSVVAAMELSRRMTSDHMNSVKCRVGDSTEVADLLMQELMYEKREIFMSLNLNVKLQVESKSVIAIGNISNAPVHPREVFGPAVRRGAAAVIVAHNHPSGDPTPSDEDIAVTGRLLEASRIMGIRLLDHLIIGRSSFVSLRAEGHIQD
jgi:DNA repair protein RadC